MTRSKDTASVGGGAHPGGNDASVASGTSAGSEAKDARPDGRSKVAVGSVRQLMRAVYAGTFKRVRLQKSELAAIRSSGSLGVSEKREITELALSDRTLERARHLMLLGVGLDVFLSRQIMELMPDLLRAHPVFGLNALLGVLDNLPEGPTEDEAVQALISHNYQALRWPENGGVMNKKESEQCKANALCCLLLWFWQTRAMSVERIQRHLHRNLWSLSARRCGTDAEKLRVLMSARDPDALSIACSQLEKRADTQNQLALAARQAEERAVAKVAELERHLVEAEEEIAAKRSEIDRLVGDLNLEREIHANDKSHWTDDYQQLRGQVLRRLKEELSLLDEGLHALRREPPKVHVMVDHAERAIDGLKREMERLRGNG